MRFSSTDFRRSVRAALGPAVIDTLHWLVSRRDWYGAQQLGRKLGAWGYRHDARHRDIILHNLSLAYGDTLSEQAAHDIAKGCLQNVTMLFIEALRLADMSREECLEICDIKGEQHLQAALDQNRGVVLFTGHLGNQEVGAVRFIHGGYNVLPLSRPPRSPRIGRKFKEIRARQNFPVIPVSEGLRGIFRALKSNCIVPVMPDRYAKGQGVVVPFFGLKTNVWHTPALLHSRTQSPVLPAHALRRPDGRFVIEIDPPVEMRESEDRDGDLVENTARLMAVLEQKVRAVPEQYAWQYRLWRGEPERAD
ncbi:MAG: hypothetical protein ABFE07_12610 [Armatimonadia bacterium]